MISLLRHIASMLSKFKNEKLATCSRDVYFSPKAKVSILWGSTRSDVKIGEKTRFYGRLISQDKGKINIGKNVKVGPGVIIGAVKSVSIGDGTILSNNIYIIDNNNHPLHPEDRAIMHCTPVGDEKRSWKYSKSAPINIGSNVWVGQQVRINKGVTVGNNSIIAANSVVTKDVPESSVVAGNPAKVVKLDINSEDRVW